MIDLFTRKKVNSALIMVEYILYQDLSMKNSNGVKVGIGTNLINDIQITTPQQFAPLFSKKL